MEGHPLLTRRGMLKRSAVYLAALSGAPFLLAACGGASSGATSAAGSASGTTQAAGPVTLQAFPTPASALRQVLPTYTKEYGYTAQVVTVSGNYYTATDTRLASGDPPFDVLQMDPGFTTEYVQKGWVQNIEGLPGLNTLMSDMTPSVLSQMKGPDGKMYTLPYYVGLSTMFYNSEILAKANLKPATDWNELLQQCQYLKSKGLADPPFVPIWTNNYNLVTGHFEVECLSRGMPGLFDKNLDPLWDKNPIGLDVLNFWGQLQKQGLVPPDAVTMDFLVAAKLMGAGRSAYFYFNSYELKTLNDPKQSAAAGNFRVSLMPGTTHLSENFASVYFLSKRNPNRDVPWTLMRFVGGTDKDGKFKGPNQISIDLGLFSGYKSNLTDPAVKAAWSKWANSDDLATFSAQLNKSVSIGPVQNAPWYSKYQQYVGTDLQKFLAGQMSASEALSDSANYVRGLAKGQA